MSGSTFAFTVTAIDKAYGPLKRIAEAMRPIMTGARGVTAASADTASAQARMTQAMAAHANGLRGHFRQAGDAFGALRGSVVAFLPMLATLGAGGSLVGLFTLTKSVAEATLAADALQKQVGITGKQLGAFTLAARMSGVPADNMAQALTKMQKAMAEAAVGQKEPLAALFKHLNIPLKDSKGAVIDVATALPKLMDAFKNTADAGLRARMASALFEEEGLKLIPMLIQGGDALERYAAMAARLKYAPSEDQKTALKAFEQGWIQLEMAASSFKTEIGARLAPVLLPVIQMATDWVVANRSWIATMIVEKVESLATAIKSIDLGRIVTMMEGWGATISAVLAPLGGMNTLIGAVTLTLGSPLLIAVSSAITVMGALGKAMVAVGALLWANPILAAVGAVVGAGVLLYTNWDWVKRQFERLWAWFERRPPWVQNLVDDVMIVAKVPRFMERAWDLAKGKFQSLWAWFKGSMGWVKPIIDALKPLYDAAADLTKYWTPVKAFFESLWQGIVEWFNWGWEKIKPIVEAIREAARLFEGLSNASPDAPGTSTPKMEGGPLEQSTPRRRGVLPRLYDPSTATVPPPAARGQVDVNVTLSNAPPGTGVATKSAGAGLGAVSTDVGYANPMGGY